MKAKTYIILISLLFLAVISGCAVKQRGVDQESAQEVSQAKPTTPPDWVLGKGHPRFPQTSYLIGVGFSDTNAVSANESARSNLAKTLKVRIRSNMKDVSSTEGTYIESVIQTEVDTVLEGVEIKDGWYDKIKGVYYSLATLERKLASSTIENRIKKVELSLKGYMRDGVEAENRADVISALSNYMAGYKKDPTLSPLKSALYVITRRRGSAESQNNYNGDFESRILRIVHNLKMSSLSGNQLKVKSQKGLSDPLVAKVYLLSDGKEIPASNIPVIFKYEKGSGELEESTLSDSNGSVQTRVHQILSFDEANHIVALKLDFDRFVSSFDKELTDKFLSPLQNLKITFNYSIQTPKWTANKSYAWRKGITGLVNQLISNIPPGETPLLGVMVFKDLRYEKTTPFSRILEEDIKTILARAEDIKIKEIAVAENDKPEEIAKANGLDFYVNGSYRMENGGLEMRARLIETQTNNINSSANTLIARKEINPEDLALLEPKGVPTGSLESGDSYQEKLEKIVAMKPDRSPFNVSVWTDKKEYQINEKIVFYVKAEESGYLTLFDVSSNGNITVIFPNKYHQDNFVRKGVTYQVPSPNYGFEFDIQGPRGLERAKAIVTRNKIPLLELNLDEGFHSLQSGSTRGMRDIKILSKQILSAESSDWAEAYSEIFIFGKEQVYTRGSRKIPILEKPEKPIDMIGTMGNEEESR
ncbi:MAG: hypothetical protein COV66_07610 [Nitrospinae bacterium CG11_big_fil_rev_8_21_14_0_20_45_15]|nr:MAG: hypothetical protein COV66_07610 [Nitrospinae bacterium CG11_big_fil_rev_8_21_14_0_20_45_15]